MATNARSGRRQRRRGRLRARVLGAPLLALLTLVIVLRASTEAAPDPSVHRMLAAFVRFPGGAPALAWPRAGEAALEVEGVGATAHSGGTTPVPIASVAKVMTAYVTLLEHPLPPGSQGFALTVTPAQVAEEQRRAADGQSTIAVTAGERITERQALQALLLPSANNVAALLAAHEGGLAAFVERMNAAARDLGMSSTRYTDPSGFDDHTVSTATDQLKLARAAMRAPVFAAIVNEQAAELPVVGTVENYDSLVGHDGYVGVKTGSDRAAGGCLIFAKRISIGAKRLTVLGVVLGQRDGSLIDAALVSAQRLGDSATAALRMQTVLAAGVRVLSVTDADGQRTSAVTAAALRAIGWGGLTLPIRVIVAPPATRMRAGERIATVMVGGVSGASTAALTTRPLTGPSLGWRLHHLL